MTAAGVCLYVRRVLFSYIINAARDTHRRYYHYHYCHYRYYYYYFIGSSARPPTHDIITSHVYAR